MCLKLFLKDRTLAMPCKYSWHTYWNVIGTITPKVVWIRTLFGDAESYKITFQNCIWILSKTLKANKQHNKIGCKEEIRFKRSHICSILPSLNVGIGHTVVWIYLFRKYHNSSVDLNNCWKQTYPSIEPKNVNVQGQG